MTLPWQCGANKEAHVSERKSPSPTLLPITVVPAIPVLAPQAPVPSSPQKEEIIYDPCWQNTSLAAIHSTPLATPSSSGTLAVQMEHRPYSATLPSIFTPTSLSTTVPDLPPHRYRQFEYYERTITTAKSVIGRSLLSPGIPWPVLAPLGGVLSVPYMLDKKVLLDNMREFICSYAEWKLMPFNEVVRVMQQDWLILGSKVSSKKKKQVWGMNIARVIEGLCILMGPN